MGRLFDSAADVPVGSASLAVTTSSGGLSSPPGTAVIARCTVETAAIRVWFDGTAPTSTVGHLLLPGDVFSIDSQLDKFRAIRDSSATANATIRVSYFGVRAQ